MGARRHPPGRVDRAAHGQHFLRSDRVAAELVDQARIRRGDLVLEIGAGTGRLTQAAVARGAVVIAVELDIDLVERLRRRFRGLERITVVHADALELPLPLQPYRVFGSVPFGIGTTLLRRLLGPGGALVRADLIVQYEVARKRASVFPGTMLGTSWAPWWEFRLVRRLSPSAFDPPPAVDAGMLAVVPRDPPLLPPREQREFVRLVRAGFEGSSQALSRSLAPRVTPGAWRRFCRERALRPDVRPRDLDVHDWVALFGMLKHRRPTYPTRGTGV